MATTIPSTIASPDNTQPKPPQTGCPTVTLTSSICGTCAAPECVQLESLTKSCGCPSAVPTVFVDFPCGSCAGLGCAASHVFVEESCAAGASPTDGRGASSPASPGRSTSSAGATASVSRTAAGNVVSGTPANTTATRTGTAVSSATSIAAAGRIRPFLGWLHVPLASGLGYAGLLTYLYS